MRSSSLLRSLFLASALVAVPAASRAAVVVGVSVGVPPPALPVYVQPPAPAPNDIWTPGYWAWDPADGYYWVPGTWVVAPAVGLLWTPGYWAFGPGGYLWHGGYWGPHVGFYGGVNYGFGYFGAGFVGGEWRGGVFAYNTAVMRVNAGVIHNTYVDNTVINHGNNHVSFNGGPNGIHARPTSEERAFASEHHMAATPLQARHQQAAHQDRGNFASENHGTPVHAAFARPMGNRAQGGQAGVAHQAGMEGNRGTPETHAEGHGVDQPHPGAGPQGGHPQGGHPEGGHPQGNHPQGEREHQH